MNAVLAAAVPSQKPPPHTWIADTLGGLTHIFDPEVQIAYYRRAPNPRITTYLATCAEQLGVGQSLSVPADAPLPGLRLPAGPHQEALLEDIAWSIEVYTQLLDCPAVALRLEVLHKPMCPRFHVDRTGIRLVCTWHGPGTEWLDDAGADRTRLGPGNGGLPDAESGLMQPGAEVGQVPPFALALLKGSLWQGNTGRGLIHRSPDVANEHGPRVMMSLDALWAS